MERDLAGYESFFGFEERPFSLTPDPKYYYRSRSHSGAFDAIAAGISRREGLVVVSGDLGVGKTTLCRTLSEVLSRRARVAIVSNPMVAPDDLLRLLLLDFGVVAQDELRQGGLSELSRADLCQRFERSLADLDTARDTAVLIVDEAQHLPASTADQLMELSRLEARGEPVLQVVLAAQAPAGSAPSLARAFDDLVGTRARLLPIERDECGRYLSHRLAIAGGRSTVTFAARALEVIYGLSGGLPRLINLIAERALHEAASASSYRIEASMVESAASALEILRLKPRRFRWFGATEGSARGTL